MLIQTPQTIWKRDPGIQEMIETLDRPELLQLVESDYRYGRDMALEALSRKEFEAVQTEYLLCQGKFEYAARNYFWIINKERQDQLLKLRESQELILEEVKKLRDKGRAQRLMILKGRQLGCSTLIEAMIAWKTMFFSNQTAIVVSNTGDHAAYLFSIMMHIYDQMPWWLKPMIASRKIEEGLLFDNPDTEARRERPGLHSLINVQAATQYSGIGQGWTVNAGHISEGTDWSEDKARDTMEGDLDKAIPQNAGAFAIWESTARGAGSYSHKLWMKNVELYEKGRIPKWLPVFLPWFFEKTQFIAPEKGWRPDKHELGLRERVKSEWVRCDHAECGLWRLAKLSTGERIEGTACPACKVGVLQPFEMSDGQLCWHWNERVNAEMDAKSLKTSKQENPTTPEEAWQISGVQVFPIDCQEFVNACIRDPIAMGFLDPANGLFHGPKTFKHDAAGAIIGTKCYQDYCTVDHRWDDCILQIWAFPEKGAVYAVGVDVAEGLGGEADYTVGWVNKVSQYPGGADVQVAMIRSNTIGPVEMALPINQLGRWYNDALMIIEWNRFDSLATQVANYYQYPNVYHWKHLDSIRPVSNKLHWNTQSNTKARLWQFGVRGMRSREWIIQAREFADEMLTFQKESYEDRSGNAEFGFHDDCLPEGVLVRTLCGMKAIEDIRVGDRVLTHKGRFMPVERVGSRYEPDSVYEIKAYGRPPIQVTSNHKLFLRERFLQHYEKGVNGQKGKMVCRTKYEDPEWLCLEDLEGSGKSHGNYGTCSRAPAEVVDIESVDLSMFVPAGYRVAEDGELIGFTRGKEVHTMRWVPRHVPVDGDFLRMLGYYMAEGSRGPHNIGFASHRRESPIRSWLIGYLKAMGLNPGEIHPSENGSVVYCSSIVLNSFFKQFKARDSKCLPKWVDFLPMSKQKEIIIGWLLGDGCLMGEDADITIATISQEAAFQLFDMSMRCGWPVSLRKDKGQNGHKEQWKIHFTDVTAESIKSLIPADLLECKRPTKRAKEQHRQLVKMPDDYLVGRIYSVKPIPFSGTVYNITVAEDRSYVANGTVISNCVMSGCIAYYGSHDQDFDPNFGSLAVPNAEQSALGQSAWVIVCRKCGEQYGVPNPEEKKLCNKCGGRIFDGKQSGVVQGHIPLGYDAVMADMELGRSGVSGDSDYAYDES